MTSDVEGPESSSASTGRSTLIVLFAVVAFVGGCSFVIDRAATVDRAETDVLENLAAEPATSVDLTIIETEATDRTPCWWWCEDDVLDVWVRTELAAPTDRSLDEVCDSALAGFSAILGAPSYTDSGNLRYRTCSFGWWDIDYRGAEVLVSLDVSSDEAPFGATIDLDILNQSSQRAFLPQGGWKR